MNDNKDAKDGKKELGLFYYKFSYYWWSSIVLSENELGLVVNYTSNSKPIIKKGKNINIS